jgi:hypothetical protein
MHSLAGISCYFNYNSDLSGDVEISVDNARVIELPTSKRIVKVYGADLMLLVAEYVRLEKISRIEQMTMEQVLGIEEPLRQQVSLKEWEASPQRPTR